MSLRSSERARSVAVAEQVQVHELTRWSCAPPAAVDLRELLDVALRDEHAAGVDRKRRVRRRRRLQAGVTISRPRRGRRAAPRAASGCARGASARSSSSDESAQVPVRGAARRAEHRDDHERDPHAARERRLRPPRAALPHRPAVGRAPGGSSTSRSSRVTADRGREPGPAPAGGAAGRAGGAAAFAAASSAASASRMSASRSCRGTGLAGLGGAPDGRTASASASSAARSASSSSRLGDDARSHRRPDAMEAGAAGAWARGAALAQGAGAGGRRAGRRSGSAGVAAWPPPPSPSDRSVSPHAQVKREQETAGRLGHRAGRQSAAAGVLAHELLDVREVGHREARPAYLTAAVPRPT